jgi:cyclic pyranopterin monophosphate synthase
MVDVSSKDVTTREATARATVRMKTATVALLRERSVPKGDVFAVATVAAIQAAKRTSELIPLCHPIPLSSCDVTFETGERAVEVQATVIAHNRTGVEMEALTAVTVASLTIYDMLKAVDRGISIEKVRLIEKKGGRSGHYRAR